MADSYDFQIESMKFRLATSDNFPYVRGTAPFRKEQFDSSPTVGDQSLTGWWTRGQLSFHMGAGLKYYEVLEGEEVLSRFTESEHLKIFEPGEVTLAVQPIDIDPTGVGAEAVAEGLNYRGSTMVLLSTFGKAYHMAGTDTPTQAVCNDGTSAKTIGVLGDYWYIATTGKKIERWLNTTYQDTKYSHTQTIYRVWGGKDRLWIVDDLMDVYAVSANPSGALPVALSSPICRITNGAYNNFSFTEDGGAVFMSAGRREIYAFVPAADGSISTLTAPATAAILPGGEYVTAIRAHMGLLCIVTNAGVRFAAIDGASLTLGPLCLEWEDSGCREIGAFRSEVVVTGEDADTSILCYAFNLESPIPSNPLIYPYRNAWFGLESAFVNGPWTGSVEYGRDGYVYWGGDNSFNTPYFQTEAFQSTLYPSGYLTTGYHRFGTLDPKRFQKVTVRAKGTGTIQVYQVTADGAETILGTLQAASGAGTFDFATTTPVERMALKFVLNRDSTDATLGPTLLGYQIKALPVPERQRILKVPLLLTDEFTLRRGPRVGHRGKAYEDATALEALESSTAIITFTDHRTGETGSAYIDSVDFQGDKPSSENSNGFGGIAYVTLRVLS